MRPAIRRSAWVVVDQAVSGLTNVAATVVIARWVDREAFGAFGVAFAVYLLSLVVVRGLVAQPLGVLVSARAHQRDEVADAAGAAVLVGCAAGAAVVAGGLVVGGQTGAVLLVLAACLPLLLLQDLGRFAMFTMAKPELAVVSDLCWAGGQMVLFGAIAIAAEPTVAGLTLAWALSGAVAAAYAVRQLRLRPSSAGAVGFLRRHGDLGVRFSADEMLHSGSVQLTALCIAGVVGTVAVGSLRGGQALFGPFSVIYVGLMSAAIPEGSRLYAREPGRLEPLLRGLSVGLGGLAVGWAVALSALPEGWGEALLGDTWPGARSLVAPLAALTAGSGAAAGGLIGLRVLAAARAGLRLRLATGPLMLGAGVLGAGVAGVRGGAWGLAVAQWVTAVGAWWIFHRLAVSRTRASGVAALR